MGFVIGFACGYIACKYRAIIWKWIQDKFDGDGGGPPAFV